MADLVNVAPGQCRLDFVNATTLRLSRFDGAYLPLKISGTWQAKLIPSAGVDLSNSGLAATTLHYVYAFDSAGTLTLEASTTVYAVDADTGVKIKSGDASRTLVGYIVTGAGSPGVFVAGIAGCLSWFNKKRRSGTANFTADRTTTSGTFVEINSEIRTSFLSWANEEVEMRAMGGWKNGAGGTSVSSLGIDGTTAENVFNYAGSASALDWPLSMYLSKAVAEGLRYVTLLGRVGAGTATWFGTPAAPEKTRLIVVVNG
jgi:hypothetical protein